LKKIKVTSRVLFLIIFIMLSTNLIAQNHLISIGGGIANAFGEGNEDINLGFNLEFTGVVQTSSSVGFGGRIGYNYFTVDTDEIEDYFFEQIDISASLSILEIVPIVRFMPNSHYNQSTNFFVQTGIGLYHMTASAEASYMGNSESDSESQTEPGITFGFGVIIGQPGTLRFEISPNFNMVFTESEMTNYGTLTLAIIFN